MNIYVIQSYGRPLNVIFFYSNSLINAFVFVPMMLCERNILLRKVGHREFVMTDPVPVSECQSIKLVDLVSIW